MQDDDANYPHIRSQINHIDRLRERGVFLIGVFGTIIVTAIGGSIIDYFFDIYHLPIRDYSLALSAERMNAITAESLTFTNPQLKLDMGTGNRTAAIILVILSMVLVLESIISFIRLYRFEPREPSQADMVSGTDASQVNREFIAKGEYIVKAMGRKFWLFLFTAVFGLYLLMVVTGRALGITIIHPIFQVFAIDVLLVVTSFSFAVYLILPPYRILKQYLGQQGEKTVRTAIRNSYNGILGILSTPIFLFLLFHVWASGIPVSVINMYRLLEFYYLTVI